MISIVPYEDKYQPDFERLNMEWLELYSLTEEYDLAILNDPRDTVINKGGAIFLVLEDDTVIGTAGIARVSDTQFELIKMAVDPAARGKGIGKLLLNRCLEHAKELGAQKISLFSSTHLKTALRMYEEAGFQYVQVSDSPMLTADIKMEKSL